MAHAHFILDTQRYRHTLMLCNTNCLSTATMIARRLLNVTLQEHCLHCCVLQNSNFNKTVPNKLHTCVISEVFTLARVKIAVFSKVTPCNLVDRYQSLAGTSLLFVRMQARCILLSLICRTCMGQTHPRLKHKLHDVTLQTRSYYYTLER
jgi:hypothetical protein